METRRFQRFAIFTGPLKYLDTREIKREGKGREKDRGERRRRRRRASKSRIFEDPTRLTCLARGYGRKKRAGIRGIRGSRSADYSDSVPSFNRRRSVASRRKRKVIVTRCTDYTRVHFGVGISKIDRVIRE